MDTVAEKIAAFERMRPDGNGECWGKVVIVEELQGAFDDERVVTFFLRLIADRAEYDMARVELLKFLEARPAGVVEYQAADRRTARRSAAGRGG